MATVIRRDAGVATRRGMVGCVLETGETAVAGASRGLPILIAYFGMRRAQAPAALRSVFSLAGVLAVVPSRSWHD